MSKVSPETKKQLNRRFRELHAEMTDPKLQAEKVEKKRVEDIIKNKIARYGL